ncbi:exodeoxyribonuclease VII large subunit [Galenea microaerophila]
MIELEVPFVEKDQAKALGARWNPAIKKWYIPDDLEAKKQEFSRWLPASLLEEVGQVAPTDQTPEPAQDAFAQTLQSVEQKGISLSALMHQVQTVLRGGFPGAVWVKAEIANINERRGHYYLELVETNENGQQLASTRAMMWANTAQALLTQFQSETGSQLQVGQNILLLAEVNFHEKFGFSLVIQDIDASFTLGALEAKLNQIRKQLIAEKLYENNKRFALPSDFFRVAVIAPPQAAGLGDFRADADELQKRGLCEFHYFYSSFQGEQQQVEKEMQAAFSAFQSLHVANPFDALVIIRGGGAKLDLNPLNSYEIAKHIALAELPVLTGIGHERDNTILDEVAAVRFDTPSKVIGAIRQAIFKQAQQAKLHWMLIEQQAQKQVQNRLNQLNQLEQTIQQQSQKQLHQWQRELQPLWLDIVHKSQQAVQNIVHTVSICQQQIEQVAQQQLTQSRHQLEQHYQQLQNRIQQQLESEKQQMTYAYQTIKQHAPKQLAHQKQAIQQWMGFILSAGPQRQMQRGFVVVKDTAGQPIKSAEHALKKQSVILEFNDGQILAQKLTRKSNEQ